MAGTPPDSQADTVVPSAPPVFASLTDVGQVRGHNEDYVSQYVPADPQVRRVLGSLFVVCDGVGGGAAGEVASEHAVKTILADYYAPTNQALPQARLIAAIQRANQEIFQENERRNDERKMATTVVAALLIDHHVLVAHAGDSRAYLIRDGRAIQITKDHSWVAQMVDAGELTSAEAESHPWRNRITRSLGMSETVEVDTQVLELQPNDALLLCSDGLSRYATDADIAAAVSQLPVNQAAKALVDLANRNGGKDNISVTIVTPEREAAPAHPAASAGASAPAAASAAASAPAAASAAASAPGVASAQGAPVPPVAPVSPAALGATLSAGAPPPATAAKVAAPTAAQMPAPLQAAAQSQPRHGLLIALIGAVIALVLIAAAAFLLRDRIAALLAGPATATATLVPATVAPPPATATLPLPTATQAAGVVASPSPTGAPAETAAPTGTGATSPAVLETGSASPEATGATASPTETASATQAAGELATEPATAAATVQPTGSPEPEATATGTASATAAAIEPSATVQPALGRVIGVFGARLRVQPSTAPGVGISASLVNGQEFEVYGWTEQVKEAPGGCTSGIWLSARLPNSGPTGWMCGDQTLVELQDKQGNYQPVSKEFMLGSGLPQVSP